VDPTSSLVEYYRSADVRARLAEYCGGSAADPAGFSARNLAGYGGRAGRHEPEGAPVRVPARAFPSLLEEGADVCRSLDDRQGLLVQLDVDYVHPNDPAEPYCAPYHCFARLEPVYHAVRRAFVAYGLDPLALITGRGYHFTVRAPEGSPFYGELVAAGRPGETLRARYRRQSPRCPSLPGRGRAHDGAGRLLEHLAHGVLRALRGRTAVPVTVADVAPPGRGPFVCLDLSAYGDPLDARSARCAFSANQKPAQSRMPGALPFVVVLPRGRATLLDLLEAREDPRRAAAMAARVSAAIPDAFVAPGWAAAYRSSPEAAFAAAFEEEPASPPAPWRRTAAGLPRRPLPACVRVPLEWPNPHLLMPVYLRSVTVGLWSLGWHPRAIAELVSRVYRQDHGWADLWNRYEPGARARFYVRLFASLLHCGLDPADEFTCAAQAARGACPQTACGFDLGRMFAALPRRPLALPGRVPRRTRCTSA
jgi:hypothetical protein